MIAEFDLKNHKLGTSNGYRFFEVQHNGYLYVKMVGKYLYKKVLSWNGVTIRCYKPYIPSNEERMRFGSK